MKSHSLLHLICDLSNKPTYKIHCQHGPNFHLTIRDEKVVLAPSDPSDEFQNWCMVGRFIVAVKDKQLFSCFALVNKASGQAIKANGDTKQVELIPYDQDVVDESILWSETHDLGDDYRAICMTANVHLNLDAFGGEDPIKNGTPIWLWKWNEGHNQRWKFTQCLNEGGSRDLEGDELTVTDMNNPHCESCRRDELRNEWNAACAQIAEANSKSAAGVQQQMEILKREINELRNDFNELRLKEVDEEIETMGTDIASLWRAIRDIKKKLLPPSHFRSPI